MQNEKAAMARELKELKAAAAAADGTRPGSSPEDSQRLAAGVEALQAALGVGAYGGTGGGGAAADAWLVVDTLVDAQLVANGRLVRAGGAHAAGAIGRLEPAGEP